MSGVPEACMIFAAGFGTRMGALTATRPKPLIEVAGRALIDHALDQARAGGATRIAVNGHYLAGQLAAHLDGLPDVTFLHETPEILDSGGGLRNALPHLGRGPVFTLNADAVWTGANALRQLAGAWRPGEMGALLLMVPAARAVGRAGGGDFRLAGDGRLDWDRAGQVFTGAQIIDPEVLRDAPAGPFSIRPVWSRLIAEGRLFGLEHAGRWADVGHPDGLALAEAMVAEDADV